VARWKKLTELAGACGVLRRLGVGGTVLLFSLCVSVQPSVGVYLCLLDCSSDKAVDTG
jgi:hypothetical protein